MNQSHFERLGLPGRFSVDPAVVEREYLARSREAHPDFHGLASTEEQRASLERSAALNEAYLTLKDWFRRAEYLLTLHGGPNAQKEKNLDQAFLMEMMDVRDRIEDAAGNTPTLTVIENELRSREAEFRQRIADSFTVIESSPADGATELVAVRRMLNAVKTIRSLLRDLPES